MKEALMDSAEVIIPDGGTLDICAIINASILESARRQEKQNELHEIARKAREAIRRVDWGMAGEIAVPSLALVRKARAVFWDRLADLVADPNKESLSQARLALYDWRLERLAVSSATRPTKIWADNNEVIEVQIASKLKVDLGAARTFYFQQPKYSLRRKKRAEAQERRRAIEVRLVRSRGTLEALEDSRDGLYAVIHKSFDIRLTGEEYEKAVRDFQRELPKLDRRYFSKTKAEVDLTFASRKTKALKASPNDKKKKKGKKKNGVPSGSQRQRGERRR